MGALRGVENPSQGEAEWGQIYHGGAMGAEEDEGPDSPLGQSWGHQGPEMCSDEAPTWVRAQTWRPEQSWLTFVQAL